MGYITISPGCVPVNAKFQFIWLGGKKISQKDTVFRKVISVQETLALTLRFLAGGGSYVSLQYLFKISKQAVRGLNRVLKKMCWDFHSPDYFSRWYNKYA
jgi:hypothetical protein